MSQINYNEIASCLDCQELQAYTKHRIGETYDIHCKKYGKQRILHTDLKICAFFNPKPSFKPTPEIQEERLLIEGLQWDS